MTGLMDIAPVAGAKVNIRGVDLEVRGLSLGDIAMLLGRFPKVAEVFSRQEGAMEAIMRSGHDIIAAIIAAGCGMAGDAEAEEKAEGLSLQEQFEVIVEVVRLTMPDGPRPFVEKLASLGWLTLPPPGENDMSQKSSSVSPGQQKR